MKYDIFVPVIICQASGSECVLKKTQSTILVKSHSLSSDILRDFDFLRHTQSCVMPLLLTPLWKASMKNPRLALNVHLLLLSIGHSGPSRETRPNHNIVKARLVFWFKSLFMLFAEYSSAVTGFRQTEVPERGLPQADLSCWAGAEKALSPTIKWNLAYWAMTIGGLHWDRLRASGSAFVGLGHPCNVPGHLCPPSLSVGTVLINPVNYISMMLKQSHNLSMLQNVTLL